MVAPCSCATATAAAIAALAALVEDLFESAVAAQAPLVSLRAPGHLGERAHDDQVGVAARLHAAEPMWVPPAGGRSPPRRCGTVTSRRPSRCQSTGHGHDAVHAADDGGSDPRHRARRRRAGCRRTLWRCSGASEHACTPAERHVLMSIGMTITENDAHVHPYRTTTIRPP